MFIIDPLNPLELIMVGTPVDTLGQLPVSVTYSQHLRMRMLDHNHSNSFLNADTCA